MKSRRRKGRKITKAAMLTLGALTLMPLLSLPISWRLPNRTPLVQAQAILTPTLTIAPVATAPPSSLPADIKSTTPITGSREASGPEENLAPVTDQIDNSILATPLKGDLNEDGRVDRHDLDWIASRYESNDPAADLNADGLVDILDLSALASLAASSLISDPAEKNIASPDAVPAPDNLALIIACDDPTADFNTDGVIDMLDLNAIAGNFGRTFLFITSLPTLTPTTASTPSLLALEAEPASLSPLPTAPLAELAATQPAWKELKLGIKPNETKVFGPI